MSKKQKHQRKKTLFDPDKILTEIHQAIRRDYVTSQHEYRSDYYLTREAFRRQVQDFTKKYCPVSYDKDSLELQTFLKFKEVNEHMRQVNEALRKELPSKPTRIQSSTPTMEKIHLRAKALMSWVLTDFEEEEWFLECKHSSGSSIGVPYSDTSMEKKFQFPISTSERVVPLFERYLQFDATLNCAIQNLNAQSPIGEMYHFTSGSRATTVDKTDEKRRMICVEPTVNMFLQQGLMEMMYKRMKSVGLDVESLPTRHVQLAHDSSITCSNATIDWSSASDCVSIELLRWLLPPKWFDVVYRVRSDYTDLNGEKVKLNMISTMGNAVTFPLETLVFWTYAHATRLSMNPRTNTLFPEWEDLKCCSVFGDDCIVPSNMASEFIAVMEDVGFIINDDKSFYGSEQFRESCGGDYLQGVDVRPYCCKAPSSRRMSSLEPWLYIIGNSLLKKYIQYFGRLTYVYDKELWKVLFDLFRRHGFEIKLVPSYYPDDAGLKISFDIERFYRHYPMKLSRIDRTTHGTYIFKYNRFNYRLRNKMFEELRLAHWLKRSGKDSDKLITFPYQTVQPVDLQNQPLIPKKWTPIRKIGGYVVAKGYSCHWYVPSVQKEA